MNDSQGNTGCVRRLEPAEIGTIVRSMRERIGLKRYALAQRAGLSEKTLERLEHGVGVSEGAYRMVAASLGFDADAFVEARYVPTEQEAEEAVRQFVQQHAVITVRAVHEQGDLTAILTASVFVVDDSLVADREAETVAAFRDILTDAGDLYKEVDATSQLAMRRQVLESACDLKARGYEVCGGMHEMELGGLKFNTAVLCLMPPERLAADGTIDVLIPRRHTWPG